MIYPGVSFHHNIWIWIMDVFLFVGLPYKSAYPNLSTKGVNETKTIDKLYIPVCKIQDRFVWYN